VMALEKELCDPPEERRPSCERVSGAAEGVTWPAARVESTGLSAGLSAGLATGLLGCEVTSWAEREAGGGEMGSICVAEVVLVPLVLAVEEAWKETGGEVESGEAWAHGGIAACARDWERCSSLGCDCRTDDSLEPNESGCVDGIREGVDELKGRLVDEFGWSRRLCIAGANQQRLCVLCGEWVGVVLAVDRSRCGSASIHR
jgi:hypothetical protein